MKEKRSKVRRNIGNSDSDLPLHPRHGQSTRRATTTTTITTNTKSFECSATTRDGSVVAGSLDGKIRLYSAASMKRAKTTFPGFGSSITHVDVTYDGKWVLATTDTYLILMCTLFTDKDGKRKTGFIGRMGNRIPAPLLLKLTSQDTHLAGDDSKFRGGQFSWVMESGKEERRLVAAVGKHFSAVWNFQQVKDRGHECYRNQQGLKSCYCYRLVPKDDSIIETPFGFYSSAEDNPPALLRQLFKEKEQENKYDT